VQKRSFVLRAMYATCLAYATAPHLSYELRYGLFLGGLEPLGYPLPVRLYWAVLTLLDPLAAVLLFVRPRVGLVLCVAIIVTDVLNNSWVFYHFPTRSSLNLGLEVAFLLFVLTTVRYAWEGLLAERGADPADQSRLKMW
jgi:hypothetical protein